MTIRHFTEEPDERKSFTSGFEDEQGSRGPCLVQRVATPLLCPLALGNPEVHTVRFNPERFVRPPYCGLSWHLIPADHDLVHTPFFLPSPILRFRSRANVSRQQPP